MEFDITKLKATRQYLGKSEMTSGNAYKVTLTYNGKKCKPFTFNDNMYNKSDKKDFLYSLYMDGLAYQNCNDLYSFMREFGYENAFKAQRDYNACKGNLTRFKQLFNDSQIEELATFFENY